MTETRDPEFKYRKRKHLGRREMAQELRGIGLTYGQIGILMGISSPGAFWLVNPDKHRLQASKRRKAEKNA